MSAVTTDAASITTTPRGRGKAAAPEAAGSPPVQLLALARLHPDPRNRAGHELDDVAELEASIREVGLLQPLLVRPREDGDWTIIAGHRRHKACGQVGLAAVLCVVRTSDEQKAIAERLIENLHRKDLTPLEEASGFKELVDAGLSQRDIAKRIGKSQPHVSRRLDLLGLPTSVVDAFVAGSVTIEEARVLKDVDEAILTEVLDNPSRLGLPVERRLAVAQATAERQAARAQAIAAIAEDGLTYMEAPSVNQFVDSYPLSDRVTVKAHEKLPCHAVGLSAYDPFRRIPLCTNPKSHPPKERKESAAEKRTRLEHERLRAEQATAKEARGAICAQILNTKPDKTWDTFLEGCLLGMLLGSVNADDLANDLGITIDEEADEATVLEDYAAKASTAERRRLLLAGAMRHADSYYADQLETEALDQLLTAHGWTKPGGTSS